MKKKKKKKKNSGVAGNNFFFCFFMHPRKFLNLKYFEWTTSGEKCFVSRGLGIFFDWQLFKSISIFRSVPTSSLQTEKYKLVKRLFYKEKFKVNAFWSGKLKNLSIS